MNKKLFKLIILSFLLSSSSCYAQVIPPANTEAGVIDKANQQIIQYNNENNNKVKKDNSTELDISTQDKDKDNANSETPAVLYNKKLNIKNIKFTGNKIFATTVLEQFTNDLLGQETTIDKVKEATYKITNLYREQGYITSFAYVPPQEISNGELTITILEGEIGNVKIIGNRWARAYYLKNNILKENNVQKNNILNVNNLKSSVSDINSNEYLKGNVVLQRGTEPKTTDIVLNIDDRFPLNFDAAWDNGGRDLIGKQRATLSAGLYNVTGFGDSLNTFYFTCLKNCWCRNKL